jgi:hypothetical protein
MRRHYRVPWNGGRGSCVCAGLCRYGFGGVGWLAIRTIVDTPHDMGIVGKHSPGESPTQGFLPRTSGEW